MRSHQSLQMRACYTAIEIRVRSGIGSVQRRRRDLGGAPEASPRDAPVAADGAQGLAGRPG